MRRAFRALSSENHPPCLSSQGKTDKGLAEIAITDKGKGRLVLHEENWLPLLRSLDPFTAVTHPIGR
jgi:hypothetical protein